MQLNEPSWKIRTRPCPFYSQGKCFFAKNCSFLHQAKSSPTVTHIVGPGDSFSQLENAVTSTVVPVTVSSKKFNDTNRSFRHHSAERHDSDSNSDSNEQDFSDENPSTIHKAILSSTVNLRDSGVSRDSMATIKADSYGSENTSHVSSSFSLSLYHAEYRKGPSVSIPSRSSQNSSMEPRHSLSPLQEDARDGLLPQGNTPPSAISVTAQEVELPSLDGILRTIPSFTLADSSNSSLIANRLARARGPAPSSPPIVTHDGNPSAPISIGALSASDYQPDDTLSLNSRPIQDTEVDAAEEAASPKQISPTPPMAVKTPSWLKPLKLPSILSSPTGSPLPLSASESEHGNDTSVSHSVTAPLSSTYASPGSSYQSSVARESLPEFDLISSKSVPLIPTDTPHTIVFSDHDGYFSPLVLSRTGSLDIDPTEFPPLPLSPDSSVHGISSPASISFSELTGRSPKMRHDANVNAFLRLEKVTTSAEQLRSALERRAMRMKEHPILQNLTDPSRVNFDDETSISSSQSLSLQSTVATSLSHSRNVLSASDFPLSRPWNNLPQIDSFPSAKSTSSASHSLLHQAQSSPPRNLLESQPTPYARPTPKLTDAAILSHTPSPHPSPRPELLFAIASDQPAEVERLLSTGQASANETTGSGTGVLEFTVTNEGLKNKTEIVKTLLKYGADPDPLKHDALGNDDEQAGGSEQSLDLVKKIEENMNPALKYFLNRPQSLDVDSKPALDVLQKSSFAPLAKARFDIIGQDRALDELYRALGVHSQRKGKNALVILLCGASGHGKSLLAQKVGSLLNVPTHTINMTALRSQHDLWQCLSTGMDDASPHLDLSEFLIENQGKRCVVVLDEIEKVDDPKSLNPLLLPWDIGRCSLEQKKHTDTSQVIWMATSNLGQRIISEHIEQWGHPDIPPTRGEYTKLATAIRRRIAEVLGASLLSRVTTILPFLPFTETEKIAIGTEAALSFQEFAGTPLSSTEIEDVVRRAVKDVNLVEDEGARSLYRVVETYMIKA